MVSKFKTQNAVTEKSHIFATRMPVSHHLHKLWPHYGPHSLVN